MTHGRLSVQPGHVGSPWYHNAFQPSAAGLPVRGNQAEISNEPFEGKMCSQAGSGAKWKECYGDSLWCSEPFWLPTEPAAQRWAMLCEAEPRKEWKGRVPLEQDPASCLEGHLTFLQEKPLSAMVKISKSGLVQGWEDRDGMLEEGTSQARILIRKAFTWSSAMMNPFLSSALPWLPLPALPPHPTSELSLREEWEDSSLLLKLSCCFVSLLLLASCKALTHFLEAKMFYSMVINLNLKAFLWA